MHRNRARTIIAIISFWVVASLPAIAVASGTESDPLGYLGITQLECRCSVRTETQSGEQAWDFQAEPVILGVDPDGPSAGKLEPGDVIVAVDDQLITTRKGGMRFTSIRPGGAVKLTVRRDDHVWVLELVAAEARPDDQRVHRIVMRPELTIDDVDGLSEALEALSDAFSNRELPAGRTEPGPHGWLGFGIECGECGFQRDAEDGTSRWHFSSSPQLIGVEPGGPAEDAGLEVGDVLTHIDGAPMESDEGSERFSLLHPGQTVTWTVQRDGEEKTLQMTVGRRYENDTRQARELDDFRSGRDSHTVRFKGSLGDTYVEVIGTPSVVITKDDGSRFLIIETADATIRLRLDE